MQDNLKELIKIIEEKSSVVDIVGDYITLEKKGNSYVGLCPFHSDSNPSMSVSDSKRIFKCFSCGAGGGVISFVQNYEGISFIESVKKIADKYNINWKKYISFKEFKVNPDEKKGIEINKEAFIFFSYNLNNSQNNEIHSYLLKRNITKDVIQKFKIGYSGEKGSLLKFLKSKKFTDDEIVKYGLGKRLENGTISDYFINRLMFSVENQFGDIVGFSGRVISDESKYSKYLNSPETPIFKKMNILYNMHNAKIPANLKRELIVVEGFMDVISLYKTGIDNVVATMGTAFTSEHTKNIARITNNITLSFDSDIAGVNATISAGKILFKQGVNVYVIEIPQEKDFDELIQSGKDKVLEVISNKKTFLDFFKNKIYKMLDSQNGTISFDIIRKLLDLISYSDDPMLIDFTLNEISKKYNIEKEILKSEMKNHKDNKIENQNDPESEVMKKLSISEKKNSASANALLNIEMYLIGHAIRNDEAFQYLVENPTKIYNLHYEKIWNSFKDQKINNKILDSEMIKEINRIKLNEDSSDFEPLDSLEEYVSYMENWAELTNIYLKEKIPEQIRATNDKKELLFLIGLLNN